MEEESLLVTSVPATCRFKLLQETNSQQGGQVENAY